MNTECAKNCVTCEYDGVTCIIPCDPTCLSCDSNGKCITCPLGTYLTMPGKC